MKCTWLATLIPVLAAVGACHHEPTQPSFDPNDLSEPVTRGFSTDSVAYQATVRGARYTLTLIARYQNQYDGSVYLSSCDGRKPAYYVTVAHQGFGADDFSAWGPNLACVDSAPPIEVRPGEVRADTVTLTAENPLVVRGSFGAIAGPAQLGNIAYLTCDFSGGPCVGPEIDVYSNIFTVDLPRGPVSRGEH